MLNIQEIEQMIQEVGEQGEVAPNAIHMNKALFDTLQEQVTVDNDGFKFEGLRVHITDALPDDKVIITED